MDINEGDFILTWNSGNTSLTKRQFEVISICAAYPDEDTFTLAKTIGISSSTFRNLLSKTYCKLGVRTRAAAIMKARQLGIIPPLAYSEIYQEKEIDFEESQVEQI